MKDASVLLTPVKWEDHWRVEMAWPDTANRIAARYFGKFDSKREVEEWIGSIDGWRSIKNAWSAPTRFNSLPRIILRNGANPPRSEWRGAHRQFVVEPL